MLTEILEARRKEREELKRQAKIGLTVGIAVRYAWTVAKVAIVVTLAGVFAILYMFFKVIFSGNTGR